jgi:hypothetical protein
MEASMERGYRRTIIARTAAGMGSLCGANAVLSAITNDFVFGLTPHGWGIGGILLVPIVIFLLFDGIVAYGKFGRTTAPKH